MSLLINSIDFSINYLVDFTCITTIIIAKQWDIAELTQDEPLQKKKKITQDEVISLEKNKIILYTVIFKNSNLIYVVYLLLLIYIQWDW